MKFGQLIKRNMKIVFLKKNHLQNVMQKLVQDIFLKN